MKDANPKSTNANPENKTAQRLYRQRLAEALKEHRRQRQDLLAAGASNPIGAMNALFADPGIFANTQRTIDVDAEDAEVEATVEAMTDDEIESIDLEDLEEQIASGEPKVAPETRLQIERTVEALAKLTAAVGMLQSVNGLIVDFAEASAPEERQTSELVSRAASIVSEIQTKLNTMKS